MYTLFLTLKDCTINHVNRSDSPVKYKADLTAKRGERKTIMEELERLREYIAQLEHQIKLLKEDNAEMDDLIIHLKAELYDYLS